MFKNGSRAVIVGLVGGALLTFGLGAGQQAQAAPAASTDSYKISVSTGASVLTGSTDAGVHCYYSCGTYLYSPFPVTAYGTTYSQMYVTTNGSIQFGDANTTTNYNTCLPTSKFAGPTFLPYWNYGITSTNYGSNVGIYYRTYGSAPYRQFVIEWREYDGETGNYQNFSEAFSESSGVVTTTYGTTGGAYATIGAQNAGGNTASQYSCGASDGATYNGLQITYTPASTVVGTKPGAPTKVSTTGDPNSPKAYIHWSPPASDGGSPITGYVVTRDGNSSTGGGSYTSPTLPADRRDATFGKLIPGATYHFTVQAINANGTGPATTVTYKERGTSGNKPGAPRIGSATAGVANGPISAKATWAAPTNAGSSAINGYTVYAYRVVNGKTVESLASGQVAASARSYNFPLDHSGQWRFRVAATNSAGAGVLSGYSNTVAGR